MKYFEEWPQSRQLNGYSERGFAEYLTSLGIIDQFQLGEGLNTQKNSHRPLREILVQLGFLEQEEMFDYFSAFLEVPRIDLEKTELEPSVVSLLDEKIAFRHCLIPVALENGRLKIAMYDPANLKAVDDVRVLTGHAVEPLLAERKAIESAIRKHLTLEHSLAELASDQTIMHKETGGFEVHEAEGGGNDAPTIRLVDSLLQEAVHLGASDIHWEPGEGYFKVRFRIDGKLETKRMFPAEVARSLIARIKVMSRLDIAERRLPQDGRASMTMNQKMIDLRINCTPTVYGEKAVIRILDPATAERSLSALGMNPGVEEGIRSIISQPSGILLVVGPTGSGKTTTLYALLRELTTDQLNIVSIEDPVEYRLPGVVPVQVNNKTGLTFANGLRSILRQDPDIIMIGEIRDEETARIAIGAAMTGHLVLSTLHTNTAAEAFTRLLDMGIEPYLLAAAIRGVVSQRLVRQLCIHCKKPRILSPQEKTAYGLSETGGRVFEAQGCPRCRSTGYAGRLGLHELLVYNLEIKELVLSGQSTNLIEKAAIRGGMIPLRQDGYNKVISGLTSLEEVWYSSSGFLT